MIRTTLFFNGKQPSEYPWHGRQLLSVDNIKGRCCFRSTSLGTPIYNQWYKRVANTKKATTKTNQSGGNADIGELRNGNGKEHKFILNDWWILIKKQNKQMSLLLKYHEHVNYIVSSLWRET